MSIKIKGDNASVTTGSNSPIINIKDKKTEYKVNWFFLSFIIGLITTIIFWITINFKIGLLIGYIMGIIFLFINPKRRFFKAGISSLLAGISTIPIFSGKLTIPPNKFFYGEFEIGGIASYIMSGIFILASLFMFYLDSKEK